MPSHYIGEICKRRFNCETHQLFSVQTTPHKLKKRIQLPVILDFCLRKTRTGKSHNYRDIKLFEKLRFQNVFRPR